MKALIGVVLILCTVSRGACELGAPVYVANWGSASSNGSTAETPVNSLQLAVSISNQVVVLTDLVGSEQCVPSIPAEYDQLLIQGPNNESLPSIQLSCMGPFLSVSNRQLEIDIQSVTLEGRMVTNTPMIRLVGEQVVLRAENVQFTSSVPNMSGWFSLATGASAYLTQCSIGNNRSISFPLMEATSDSQLVLVDTMIIGSPFDLCDFFSSCMPDVMIGGGSAVFDGCYSHPLDSVPSLIATVNTSLKLINSSHLFFQVASLGGNVTIPLGPYITSFFLRYSVLTVEPSASTAIVGELPALTLWNSVVFLPDTEVASRQPITLVDSLVYGRGLLLNARALSIQGSVIFYDCPVNTVTASFEQSLLSPASATFIGAKGPSGADLVASVCTFDKHTSLNGALSAETLNVFVPHVFGGATASSMVSSFSGWPNSKIFVALTAVTGFQPTLNIPVLTIGTSVTPNSQLNFLAFEDVKLKNIWWHQGRNSTTLRIKAEYKIARFVTVIVAVCVTIALIGMSVWAFVVYRRRSRSISPVYENIPG